MPATAVLLSKIAELEASLQSTENYWKSKYEAEVDKVKKLQTEAEGFKSICNEYLCGPEASWQDLSNWCEDKTDEIVEINDELEDLEEQVTDLKEQVDGFKNRPAYATVIWERDCLKDEVADLKEKTDEIQSFLKVCDRNSDGYYEHYETRQIATRLEGGVYEKA